MAAMREYHHDPTMAPMEEEDIRGDGKKKKFKPLSAVRKLFGGRKSRKKEGSVKVKALSTNALHSEYVDTDDDDGGFASHAPLSPNIRSISQDSIFSPEPREPIIGAFPALAVSEDSLAQTAFQSELFTKLNKRRSQYSDDDDGLPHSPVPPVTTADVVLGGGLKAAPSWRKTNTRDSDQSLISADGSEFEEEDIIQTKWKGPTTSSKFYSESHINKDKMEPLDFNNIEKTEVLGSAALKDRMSVKPRGRKATRRTSRRRADTASPLSLPSLNEESPTKQTEVSSTKSRTNTGAPSTASKSHRSSSPTLSKQTTPTTATKPFSPTTSTKPFSPTTASKPTVEKETPLPTLPPRPKSFVSSPASAAVTSTVTQKQSGYSRATSGIYDNNFAGVSSPNSVSPSSQNTADSKPGLVFGTQSTGSGSQYSGYSGFDKKVESSSYKSSTTSSKPPLPSPSNPNQKGYSPSSNSPALKITDPDSTVTLSPKEDYKIKRQTRSKTLPVASEDAPQQISPNVQRANSHRLQSSPTTQQKDITSGDTTSAGAKSGPLLNVGKLESSRFTGSSATGPSSEPSWMNMVRKRKEESEKPEKEMTGVPDKQSETVLSTAKRPVSLVSSTTQQSIYSSSSAMDKKRGSVHEVTSLSSKGHEPGVRGKDVDTVSPRSETLDIPVKELPGRGSSTKGPASYAISTSVKSPKEPTSSAINSFRGGSIKTSPTKPQEPKSSFLNRPGSVKAPPTMSNVSQNSKFESPTSKFESVPLRKPTAVTSEDSGMSSSPSPSSSSTQPSQTLQQTSTITPLDTDQTSKPQNSFLNSAKTSSAFSKPPISSIASPSQTSAPVNSQTPVAFGVKPLASSNSHVKPINSSGVKSSFPVSSYASSSNVASSSSSKSSFSKPSTTITSSSSSSIPSFLNKDSLLPSKPTTTTATTSSSSSSFTSRSINPSRATSLRAPPSSFLSSSISTQNISSPSSSSTSSSRATNINKSPSMRVQPTATTASANDNTAKVPTWRANLQKKKGAVEIEIIEKKPLNVTKPPNVKEPPNVTKPTTTTTTNENQSQNLRKSQVADKAKKTDTNSSPAVDKASNRSSKVLDMVKNFQNFKVST